MEMFLSQKDVAIEFNALHQKLLRMIDSLEEADINVQKEKKDTKKTKAECDRKAKESTSVSEAERIYNEGIDELNKIKERLERHEVYFLIHNDTENINDKLARSNNLTAEQISELAEGTIDLLDRINKSDTRAYDTEADIVDEVYALAYKIIKIEVLNLSKSSVLDWVKADSTAADYINSMISSDVKLLEEQENVSAEFTDAVAAIEGEKLDHSYLYAGIILYIALNDEEQIGRIENDLLAILDNLAKNEDDKKEGLSLVDSLQEKINELTANIKKNRIKGRLAIILSAISLFLIVKQNSKDLVAGIGHETYRTYSKFYSNSTMAEAPEYPEYMEKIDGWQKTTMVGYGPWTREHVFYGDYQREIVTFDLGSNDWDTFEEFLALDFSSMHKDSETETRTSEEMDPNDLYADAIVEITKIIQDENDHIFVPNEEAQRIVEMLILATTATATSIGSVALALSIAKRLRKAFENRSLRKEETAKYKKALEAYNKLCEENEEFRKAFITLYEKYQEYLKNKRLEEAYRTLKMEKDS